MKKRQRKNAKSTSTNINESLNSTPLLKKVKRAYKRAQTNEKDEEIIGGKVKRKRGESKKSPKKTNNNKTDTLKSLNSEANTSISSSCSSFSYSSSSKSNSNNSDLTTSVSKSLFGKFRVRVAFLSRIFEFLVGFLNV